MRRAFAVIAEALVPVLSSSAVAAPGDADPSFGGLAGSEVLADGRS